MCMRPTIAPRPTRSSIASHRTPAGSPVGRPDTSNARRRAASRRMPRQIRRLHRSSLRRYASRRSSSESRSERLEAASTVGRAARVFRIAAQTGRGNPSQGACSSGRLKSSRLGGIGFPRQFQGEPAQLDPRPNSRSRAERDRRSADPPPACAICSSRRSPAASPSARPPHRSRRAARPRQGRRD